MLVENPILRGFHADPSIIRVGEDYYIANSTFEWFPGVRLHHSRDLKHWETMPSPLRDTTMLDMRGIPSSGGIWAPDLSYADGLFWLIYTNVRQPANPFKDVANYVTTAPSITGPWSVPTRLNGVGFDPSLFHDDDGRKYLVQQTWDHREYHHPFNGITLTEFDPDMMRLKPQTRRIIWHGDTAGFIEGPHLYKHDELYYLFAAQGGTTYTHQEAVARSETLDAESFLAMPGNPLIGNYDTPYTRLQKQGHGSLVDAPDGRWYYASLCGRPWHHASESHIEPRGWCSLGRETSLQEVVWDESGWPHIVGGPAGRDVIEVPDRASSLMRAPESSAESGDDASSEMEHHRDEFDDGELGLDWNTLRVPFNDDMGRVGGGRLELRGQGSLRDLFELSLVARRWQAFDFDAQTKMCFEPDTYQAMAGLTNYYNDWCWSWVFVTYDESRGCRVIEVAECDRGIYRSMMRDRAVPVPEDVEWIWLRTRVRTQSYCYEYSFDGDTWTGLPVTLDAAILSDEAAPDGHCGFFTGAFVGLAAVDYSGYGATAVFDYFDYRELA